MTDPITNPVRAAQPIQPIAPGAVQPGAQKPRGPAFEALLERLEQQARALEEESQGVDGPAQLAGAVDRAQASLTAALSLGDQVLEAFRQSLRQSTAPAADPHAEDGSSAGRTPR